MLFILSIHVCKTEKSDLYTFISQTFYTLIYKYGSDTTMFEPLYLFSHSIRQITVLDSTGNQCAKFQNSFQLYLIPKLLSGKIPVLTLKKSFGSWKLKCWDMSSQSVHLCACTKGLQALGSVKRLETIVLLWRYINQIEFN